MSTPESVSDLRQYGWNIVADYAEQRSSVEITLNAKRETQVRVKMYVGDTEEEVEATRAAAVDVFAATMKELAEAERAAWRPRVER